MGKSNLQKLQIQISLTEKIIMSQNRQPHIGCTLSLTSKANIRYEGVLKGIDTEKCTLTLNNVQSFGTEDRSSKVIPPSQDIYDLIIFNGHDIQDVQVVDDKVVNDEPAIDPAIMRAEIRKNGSVENQNKKSSPKNNNQSSY